MEYTRLGKSGLKISKVILGTMSYGDPKWQGWVLGEEEALPLLEHAYKAGINTWDTADVYSNGRSEETIAKALAKFNIPRQKVVLLSKCYFAVEDPETATNNWEEVKINDGRLVNQVGLSRKHVFDAVEASVKRLGTYIDVLQIHRLDKDTPREEIMKALNDVIEKGWVRYIGASSMAAWEFQALQNVADKNGWHKFISMQNYYNLVYREEEREMLPYCRDAGVGCIPWSPIARGLLARPWRSASDSLREKADPWLALVDREDASNHAIVSAVEAIAKERGVAMATVATAWCLSKEGVNPIIGLNSTKRIDEIVEAMKVKLTEEEIKRLEEAYVPKAVAPMW